MSIDLVQVLKEVQGFSGMMSKAGGLAESLTVYNGAQDAGDG
jgi:hypothetical protein